MHGNGSNSTEKIRRSKLFSISSSESHSPSYIGTEEKMRNTAKRQRELGKNTRFLRRPTSPQQNKMATTETVLIKIKRQLTPDAKPSWEEFEIPYKPNMNVTSALMEIAANPVTRDGKQTTPV